MVFRNSEKNSTLSNLNLLVFQEDSDQITILLKA